MRLCCAFADSTISLVDLDEAPPHIELSCFSGSIRCVHVLERLTNCYSDPVHGIVFYEELVR